jgi:hypothetical protein
MKCLACGRDLVDEASVARGFGPCCARTRLKAIARQDLQASMIEDNFDLPFDGRYIACRRELGTGAKAFNFPHALVKHSPFSMDWGYGGNGPADFAINALSKISYQMAIEPLIYHEFKWQYVARLPEIGGTIPIAEIKLWLEKRFGYRDDTIGGSYVIPKDSGPSLTNFPRGRPPKGSGLRIPPRLPGH